MRVLTINRQRRVDERRISREKPEHFRDIPFCLPDQFYLVVKREREIIGLCAVVNVIA